MPKKSLLGVDKNEKIIHEFKQHKIGIFGIWLLAGIAYIAILYLLYIFVDNQNLFGIYDSGLLAGLVASLLTILLVIIAAVQTYVFLKNELIVTDQNIVEITQYSLFNRQVSHLNLANVQEVSATQKGLLASIFNYGTITIESAGEKASFEFRFTPNANVCAKYILEAHENYKG